MRERRGLQGGVFRMLKFRSMRIDPADAAAESRPAGAGDERVFPFGRFLRRRSLHEFPQFWNVICGDMSVVGPRPYMPLLDDEFRQHSRGYRTRHLVKPGITGLAHSLGYRGEILEQEMLRRRVYWDVYYITHWSGWLDLQITARTLWQIFRPPPTAYWTGGGRRVCVIGARVPRPFASEEFHVSHTVGVGEREAVGLHLDQPDAQGAFHDIVQPVDPVIHEDPTFRAAGFDSRDSKRVHKGVNSRVRN